MIGQSGAFLLILAAALPSIAAAQDNLTCIGPFGRITGEPILNARKNIAPRVTVEICLNVPKDRPIVEVRCYIMRFHGEARQRYRCPLGQDCAGLGAFSELARRITEGAAADKLCVSHKSSSPQEHEAGISIRLPPPAN